MALNLIGIMMINQSLSVTKPDNYENMQLFEKAKKKI